MMLLVGQDLLAQLTYVATQGLSDVHGKRYCHKASQCSLRCHPAQQAVSHCARACKHSSVPASITTILRAEGESATVVAQGCHKRQAGEEHKGLQRSTTQSKIWQSILIHTVPGKITIHLLLDLQRCSPPQPAVPILPLTPAYCLASPPGLPCCVPPESQSCKGARSARQTWLSRSRTASITLCKAYH